MAGEIVDEAKARNVLRQVEFYFSDSNLPRDGFLRRAVEESEDGLVSLALICSFGRMRSILGLDNDTKPESVPADIVDAVSEVLKSRSTTLRISDDGKKVGRIAELLKSEELIEQLDSRTIAASPFPYDITLEDVETFFSKQAKVSSVRLPKHVSDKRYFCGTVLIEFSEEEDAKKILEENLVFAGAELALKPKKEYDTEREKQIEEHKKKNADKGRSYPKGVVISFQLEKKKKSSDITDSKKIEPENEKENALDSIEKPTGEEAQENKSEEVKGEHSESAEEKPSEEGHDSKPENAESISNDIGGTQITREDLKHVFGKFGNVKYIDFSMGQESGYIRYEDSEGVETAHAMAEVSEGGGLLVKDHIATVEVVTGEEEKKYWKELQEKRENKFDNSRGGARNRGGRRESFGKHGRWNDSTDKRPQIAREDLKHVFEKFGNVKYIDFSMGQESGYIRYEDSKGVETARAMAEVSEGGGLLVKDHIAPVQVVTARRHMALIFSSTDVLPTALDPQKEPDQSAAAANKKAKTSAPTSKVTAPNKVVSGEINSYKRKGVSTAFTKVLTEGEKGKAPALGKEKEKERKKSRTVGIVFREPLNSDVQQALTQVIAPAPEKEVPTSTSAEISEPGEELRAYLKSVIPDEEKAIGLVWRTNLAGFSDSLGIHLPGYTSMQNETSKRVANHPKYSREVFRATATAHQKKWTKKNTRAAMNHIMSAAHDIGVYAGYLKDVVDKGEVDLEVINTDGEMVKKAVLERNYFHNLLVSKSQQLVVKENELVVEKKAAQLKDLAVKAQKQMLEARSQELAAKRDEVDTFTKELESRTGELQGARAENEGLKKENARLQEELQRAGPEAVARFMVSDAFTQAAPLACLNAMKFTVYRELKKVASIYPFTPEQAGFAEVPLSDAVVNTLPEFKWVEKDDRLITPEGTPYSPQLKLEDHPPRPFPHQWKKRLPWPTDVDVEEMEVVEEEAHDNIATPPEVPNEPSSDLASQEAHIEEHPSSENP